MFDLYKGHQDATLIYSHVENENTEGGVSVPCISHSASINDNGEVLVTLSNCALDKEYEIDLGTAFGQITAAEGRMVTGDARAYNDFTNTDNVVIRPIEVKTENGKASVVLPACSVAAITIKL